MTLPAPLLDMASLPMTSKELLAESSLHSRLLKAQKDKDEETFRELECLMAQSGTRLKAALDCYLSDIEYESTIRNSTETFAQLHAIDAID